MLGWGEGSSSGKSAFPDDRSRCSPISRYETIGESQLPFVPIGDLQTEAGAAFGMKSGLAGGRFPQRMAAWRAGACVVGPLHVRPGRSLGRAPRPRPRPQHPSGRAAGVGGRRLGLAAGPASAASNWAWVRASPPTAFPLERVCERRAPIGPCGLSTKFKDFKSTSWRLLGERAL